MVSNYKFSVVRARTDQNAETMQEKRYNFGMIVFITIYTHFKIHFKRFALIQKSIWALHFDRTNWNEISNSDRAAPAAATTTTGDKLVLNIVHAVLFVILLIFMSSSSSPSSLFLSFKDVFGYKLTDRPPDHLAHAPDNDENANARTSSGRHGSATTRIVFRGDCKV